MGFQNDPTIWHKSSPDHPLGRRCLQLSQRNRDILCPRTWPTPRLGASWRSLWRRCSRPRHSCTMLYLKVWTGQNQESYAAWFPGWTPFSVLQWRCLGPLGPLGLSFGTSEPRWDLWMFIPLKLLVMGFDPPPYDGYHSNVVSLQLVYHQTVKFRKKNGYPISNQEFLRC